MKKFNSTNKMQNTKNINLNDHYLLQIYKQKGINNLIDELIKNQSSKGDKSNISDRLCRLATLIQRQNPSASLILTSKSLEFNQENINALLIAGLIYDKLGDRKLSAESMLKVINSKKSNPEQILKASNLLVRFGAHKEALESAKSAFYDLKKPLRHASSLMYIAKITADWKLVEELKEQMTNAYADGNNGQFTETPRTHLLWCGDEKLNISVIKKWSENTLPIPENILKPELEKLDGRRIRIGYLSSDFRDHPTSRLINGLLRNHDRKRFELFMYCSGWDDHSDMRREIESQFEHQYSVSKLGDEEAALIIQSHKIDILLELNGPTRANRMGILAYRPAPIQIDYLGWPGSVGGRLVDYIIADEYTVPENKESLYPEKIIKIPKTYQINDFIHLNLPQKPNRNSVGLPEGDYFILGMFNAINKVDSIVWSAWMKILIAVPNSILWLLDPGSVACRFIAKETKTHGIDIKRIIIAPRLKQDLHLARIQYCDLMLDPWPYGGHTSTSDALFAGVPVISLEGTNFASRVSGGLLHAAGLGLLVQRDIKSYIQNSINLLKNPKVLTDIKKFLKTKSKSSILFNSSLKTLHLENEFMSILSSKFYQQENKIQNLNKSFIRKKTIWFNITISQNWKKNPVGIVRTEIEIIKNIIILLNGYSHGFIEYEDGHFRNCIPNKFSINSRTTYFDSFVEGDTLIDLGLDFNCTYSSLYEKLKNNSINIIMVVYDLIPIIFPHFATGLLQKNFKDYLLNVNRVSTHLLFISKRTKQDFDNLIIKDKNENPLHKIITLGSSLTKSNNLPSKEIEKFINSKFILYVSTIERRKNHDILYKAYNYLSSFKNQDEIPFLLFVGQIGWGVNDLMVDIALDPLVNKKIFILKDLRDSDLALLYQNCLFAVYPSLYEGWGLPVAESLSFGKFVLCSDKGSLPEVGATFVEYIDIYDVYNWAKSIEKYSSDYELLKIKESKINGSYIPTTWHDTAKEILSFMFSKKII